MASAMPELRLPSQPQSVTAVWPLSLGWQRHTDVSRLHKARTWIHDLWIASSMSHQRSPHVLMVVDVILT